MAQLPVADFQGNFSSKTLRFEPSRKIHPTADAIPSEDVQMDILKRKVAKAVGDEGIRHRAALEALIKLRQDTEEFFKNLVGLASRYHLYDHFLKASVKFTDFDCYLESIRLIKEMCPGMKVTQNDYALRRLRVLANMCESDIPEKKIMSAIGKVSYESTFC